MIVGLDFWATDAFTDSQIPFPDEWSTTFLLQELMLEAQHEWLLQMLREMVVDSVDNQI